MAQYALHLDGTRCTGCKTCVYACKDKNDLDLGSAYRRVFEYSGGTTTKAEDGSYTTDCFSYYVSLGCNHCDDPKCVEVCPTGAMHKREEDGIVLVDNRLCIGCGYCHFACPYGVPEVDRQKGHSVKCDMCVDYVLEGKDPACVAACPSRALTFGEATEIAELGERADIAPLPSAETTRPNYYITPCRDARPAGSDEGHIGNVKEVL